MSVTTKIEKVTPRLAEKYLQQNDGNFRKTDIERVRRYSKEMADGKFVLNGSSIVFSSSGRLLDGQHRLKAVVESGVTVQMVVVTGVAEDSAWSMDRGQPRTVAQWLSHLGVKNCNVVAACARLTVAHDRGLWANQSITSGNVTDSETIEAGLAYADAMSDSLTRTVKGLSGSIGTTIAFLGSGKKGKSKSALCTWFFDSLANGENIGDSDPVFHLRSRLLDSATSARKLSPHMVRMLTTLAWNKTVAGESCTASGIRIRASGPCPQKLPEQVEIADDVTQ